MVKQHLEHDENIYLPSVITGWENTPLRDHVEVIRASESTSPDHIIAIEDAVLEIHVYQPGDADLIEEFTSGRGDGGDEVMAATVCDLPSRGFEGLWDSLVYPDDIKPRLLNYIYATLLFSDADVDFNIVSWNRVVLLHGPPGTGKTSLCRALAQKLSIRLSQRYAHSKLIEINSHSLFSRWFSESGKLVQKLFTSINEMVEDEGSFVVVLIDEVESLTAARAGALSGNEPSDALRVVNALLTQLDKLKHRKNVLVMSTSNLAKAIDSAYVDRADIVQYVGLPPREAIYWILRTCLVELMRTGIISLMTLLDAESAEAFYRNDVNGVADDMGNMRRETSPFRGGSGGHSSQGLPYEANSQMQVVSKEADNDDGEGGGGEDDEKERARRASVLLFTLADKCKGMSGRSLRRLPVLAHARHIGVSSFVAPSAVVDQKNGSRAKSGGGVPIEVWLKAMTLVVETELGSRRNEDMSA